MACSGRGVMDVGVEGWLRCGCVGRCVKCVCSRGIARRVLSLEINKYKYSNFLEPSCSRILAPLTRRFPASIEQTGLIH